VLPALLVGKDKRDGMKMGEDEQDIVGMVGQLCGMYRVKGVVKW